MDKERWGILYCPKGGLLQSPARKWERIDKALRSQHIEYDMVQSESSGSVDRLVKMLINNGYKTIVIVGGDSALNDAVNCLMQIGKQQRDEITLGIIPNGMMNDFARFWDIQEGEIESTIASLKKHRIRKIDLGVIRYMNRKRENCHRYFVNCVNVGFIASIMNLRRQTHHIFGSRTLSFLASFILMIFQRMDYMMHLKVNDDELKRRIMTVCVGNASGYGQTPNAVPYNGLLDVSVVYHPQMTQLFEGIYLFVKGKFLNHRSVHPYRTHEVRFHCAEHAMVGVDGRMMSAPFGEFKISVEQEVINFLIPS